MMDNLTWIFVVCMLVESSISQINDCTGSQREVDFCRFNRTECFTYNSNLLYRLSFSTADLTENGFCSCRLYSNELFSIHIKYVEITTPGYRDNAAIYEVCEPYQRDNVNAVKNDTILNDISEIGFSLQQNNASGTKVYVNLVGAYLFEIPEPSSAQINVSCNLIQLHEMNECYMSSYPEEEDSLETSIANSSSENTDSNGLLVTVIIVVVVVLLFIGICICGIYSFLRKREKKEQAHDLHTHENPTLSQIQSTMHTSPAKCSLPNSGHEYENQTVVSTEKAENFIGDRPDYLTWPQQISHENTPHVAYQGISPDSEYDDAVTKEVSNYEVIESEDTRRQNASFHASYVAPKDNSLNAERDSSVDKVPSDISEKENATEYASTDHKATNPTYENEIQAEEKNAYTQLCLSIPAYENID